MRKTFLLPIILICITTCNQTTLFNSISEKSPTQFIDSTDMTNNFYDNTETYQLPVKELTVEGEIANPGKVDFSVLQKHSVIVKETLLDSSGKDRFVGAYPFSRENLQTGIMCISAEDGYRSSFSFSEIFNRNDQQEFLLVKTSPGEDGGIFRMFPACDFFSDRAIKSVSEIHLGW